MKISRTVTYALQATLMLASSPQRSPIPCSKLAKQGAMPERFLLQILRSLVKAGLLQSSRGVVGGYSLAREAREISLLDVIESVEGPLAVEFSETERLPVAAAARLHQVLHNMLQFQRAELAHTKLSHLLEH